MVENNVNTIQDDIRIPNMIVPSSISKINIYIYIYFFFLYSDIFG